MKKVIKYFIACFFKRFDDWNEDFKINGGI